MKVLVACEFSGVVRDAFRKLGHDAWSCDLLLTDVNPQFHIQGNVIDIINSGWDLMIAHPPCTYLANSGVQHMYNNRKKDQGINQDRWGKMEDAVAFFNILLNSPIAKIAIENPVPHGFAKLPKYDQIVQPYYFGEEAQKKTCLWLKGLPPLKSTKIVGKGEQYYGKNGKKNGSTWYQLPPTSVDRWKHRSKTFQSIANAMADQWGDECKAELENN